jgi:hypothetical protein
VNYVELQAVLATYAHLMLDDTERGRKAMDAFFAGRSLSA